MRFLSFSFLFCLSGQIFCQTDSTTYSSFLSAIEPFEGTPYPSHRELRWQEKPGAEFYRLIISDKKGGSQKTIETKKTYFLDFFKKRGEVNPSNYILEAIDKNGATLFKSNPISFPNIENTEDNLLDMVQRYTFRYFWDFADPYSGLTLERTNDTKESCVTIGGSGFGLMTLICGVERGFITEQEAIGRINKVCDFLEKIPRFKGAWAHWYNGKTAEVYSFSEKDNGGDLVETSFMIQGLLAVREYFQDDYLKNRIDKLWQEVNWKHYTQGEKVLYWHFSPDWGFGMNHKIKGYNEALITYILAASSPTFPISADVYTEGWASWNQEEFSNYSSYYGMVLPLGNKRYFGGPLFFAHYSYLGLCPLNLRDRYADYWQQNTRQTLINRAYCIDNPYNWKGYGEDLWGLTACDGVPEGYLAHSPGFRFDTGVIAPTASLSSYPYTPQYSLQVLKNMYENYSDELFGVFGFYDAIRPANKQGEKVRKNYIAIDQAPIIIMIENYRTKAVWKAFMQNQDVLNGLKKLGFKIEQN